MTRLRAFPATPRLTIAGGMSALLALVRRGRNAPDKASATIDVIVCDLMPVGGATI